MSAAEREARRTDRIGTALQKLILAAQVESIEANVEHAITFVDDLGGDNRASALGRLGHVEAIRRALTAATTDYIVWGAEPVDNLEQWATNYGDDGWKAALVEARRRLVEELEEHQ